MAKHVLNNRPHHTIMGDEFNHELFCNPNINIQQYESDDNDTSDAQPTGITLMGFSTDSKQLQSNHVDDDYKNRDVEHEDDGLLSNKSNSITLMGSSSDLMLNVHGNRLQNGITLMGNTETKNTQKRMKHKQIPSESYWRMFVFQQPQIFTQILSYLLPFQKLQIAKVAMFMNEFIVHSQLKYTQKSQIKLKTKWQNYDVVDYDLDQMIWNKHYSVFVDILNYKSFTLDIGIMNMDNIWNSNYMKQLKYYFVNQTKLSSIYDAMERHKMEQHNEYMHGDEHTSLLSQTLHNITSLHCTNYGTRFGINGTIFCSDLLCSNYCNIQSLYLSNNALNDACVDTFCTRLLLSNQRTSSLVELDLSHNVNITAQCVEILFTLIGEKCNELNTLCLSATSVDDSVCAAIFDYYRCHYGSSLCNLQCIEMMDNKHITINGVHVLNKVFQSIISDQEEDLKFNLMKCERLEDLLANDANEFDYRIIISPQSEQQYIEKRATYTQLYSDYSYFLNYNHDYASVI